MSREAYVAVMLGFAVALPALLVASMILLPRVAPRLINLPNRERWLAPARRRPAHRRRAPPRRGRAPRRRAADEGKAAARRAKRADR